eukprot:4004337-Ditylum_brightwellii.AAC.1
MSQESSDERYPYFCIIKVHDQVESNTFAEAKAFGKLLEKDFSQVAKEEFKFPSEMVIDYTYPIDQYTHEEQAENLWEDFLGKGEE